MTNKRWSYRTKRVAAALVAFAALFSVGFGFPGTALADCIPMSDGSCKPVVQDREIIHTEQDGTDIFGPEGRAIAAEVAKDMPIQTSGTPESPVIVVDRKQVKSDVLPFIDPATNRTMVPLRFIAEALNAEVDYDAEKAIINREGLEVLVWYNTNKATINGREVYLDAPAVLVPPGRTMVPLRFISEAFGAKVDWVGANGPDDPRAKPWDGGKFQVWIWAPWMFWGNYNLGDRNEAGSWNLR